MKYIKKIETESCEHGSSFDIVYLNSGPVIVLNDERIGVFKTEEEFNSGDGDPEIIEFNDNENETDLNLN